MLRVLFIFTSASKNLLGDATGWFLPEAAHPYYVLSPHYAVDFASPAGANPPLDPKSVKYAKDDEVCQRFLVDPTVKSLLENAKPLSAVRSDDYVALFYVGGAGPVFDLVTDETNTQLATEFYRSDKVIGAICHGAAALLDVTGVDGTSIFKGKTITAFSNAEEEEIGNIAALPFMLEDRVGPLGGTYEKADKPWGPKVVHSGNLITGQNPASARPLADELLKTLLARV